MYTKNLIQALTDERATHWVDVDKEWLTELLHQQGLACRIKKFHSSNKQLEGIVGDCLVMTLPAFDGALVVFEPGFALVAGPVEWWYRDTVVYRPLPDKQLELAYRLKFHEIRGVVVNNTFYPKFDSRVFAIAEAAATMIETALCQCITRDGCPITSTIPGLVPYQTKGYCLDLPFAFSECNQPETDVPWVINRICGTKHDVRNDPWHALAKRWRQSRHNFTFNDPNRLAGFVKSFASMAEQELDRNYPADRTEHCMSVMSVTDEPEFRILLSWQPEGIDVLDTLMATFQAHENQAFFAKHTPPADDIPETASFEWRAFEILYRAGKMTPGSKRLHEEIASWPSNNLTPLTASWVGWNRFTTVTEPTDLMNWVDWETVLPPMAEHYGFPTENIRFDSPSDFKPYAGLDWKLLEGEDLTRVIALPEIASTLTTTDDPEGTTSRNVYIYDPLRWAAAKTHYEELLPDERLRFVLVEEPVFREMATRPNY